jgi:excisionase family DNA binding protein
VDTEKQPVSQPEQVYSVPDTSKLLNCSERTIWRLIDERKIGHVKINRRVGVTRKQIDAYLQANTVHPIDAGKIASKIWARN